MNKILKKTIITVKKLHKKDILYLYKSINVGVKVNHQVVAKIVENLKIFMDEKRYETLYLCYQIKIAQKL